MMKIAAIIPAAKNPQKCPYRHPLTKLTQAAAVGWGQKHPSHFPRLLEALGVSISRVLAPRLWASRLSTLQAA